MIIMTIPIFFKLRELFLFCPLSLLDKKDEQGNNLVGIACMCGFINIFHMLLDKGANINLPNVSIVFSLL